MRQFIFGVIGICTCLFPVASEAGLNSIKKELHFQLYNELITSHKFGSPEYWISIGRVQAISEAIYLIDVDILGIEK